jgi:phage tail sheath gpL-like
LKENKLTSELFHKIIVNFFDENEIKKIAKHLLDRLDVNTFNELSVVADKNNLSRAEFLAVLIQTRLTSLDVNLLTPEEQITFQKFLKYIN